MRCKSPSAWRVGIEIIIISFLMSGGRESPSAWRVWIEISLPYLLVASNTVTLRMEGVDRNTVKVTLYVVGAVTLRMEGVDRNTSYSRFAHLL